MVVSDGLLVGTPLDVEVSRGDLAVRGLRSWPASPSLPEHGAQDQGKTETKNLFHRNRNIGSGNSQARPETKRLPRRLELPASAPMSARLYGLFMRWLSVSRVNISKILGR